MKTVLKSVFLTVIVTVFALFQWSCKQEKDVSTSTENVLEVLPSFNESTSKKNIIQFVETITDTASSDYVKPDDRIACFDNDGTLWVEQPLPSQIFFDLYRIKQLAVNHPEWKNEMPFKAVIENDTEALKTLSHGDLLNIVGTAQATDDVDSFDTIVNNWITSTKHPVMDKPYTKLIYKPMLELLDYLRANEFKIYIVSGGSQEFMRAWTNYVYGIPKEHVIGSTFKRKAITKGDSLIVAQTSEFEFNDDHEGKAIAISRYIGKKPILIAGNSDGDLEMMQYCDTNNPLPHLLIYVNHTDGDREFLYDEHTAMGTLNKGMEVALRKGWTIIDMKNDWKTVHSE
ncbi:HAD family hydrolase [Aestuariibaculum sediminum]|uniref:phosphoserine phosphatase n=1 Tax=Aestuariibaculum sediminum TaxID=2770637 RepID=A0A8J6PXE3_9FLAO|nr:HAD family hydrolase [Aestuariibaculum sediminum]MBD0830617.1 haloacid dehalogenase-like hydrolase [Aestuariibaculum sediminum]